MPRPKENAPAPVQFNLQELQLGRRKFRSGTSGAPVQLRPMGQQQPEKIPRYETLLCGKIMFGNKRFSFETLELDRSHANINKILKRKNVPEEEKIPTLLEVLLARTRAPLYSFQVKFEDVQSLECRGCGHEWELVLNLKKPPSCYSKTNGSSWETVESPVASAKTIRCVTRAPGVKDEVAWKCGNEVPFAQARDLAMQSSPMLAALFNGMPVEKETVAPKRKANQDAPGNVSKRLRKEAMGAKLSEKGEELLAVEPVKESLNEYVKSLAHTVDMDWHDSYEETDEMLVEWFSECGDHVQKVIKAATSLGAGFGHAHEILKCIHDTWLNINAIPFRGCPSETLSDANHEVELINGESLTSVEDMLQIVWPLLLARAASDSQVADGSLNQMLKDAHDNGVSHPEVPHESEPQLLAQLAEKSATSISSTLTRGRRRLSALEAAGAWKSFPCTVKKHRMRRCIDRRFDGPKHLRTRDYGSDSDDGFGCGLGGLGAFLGLF